MPRGRCHIALAYELHECLRQHRPEAAELLDQNLSGFVAGAFAPDALRAMGKLGKWATHFYAEDRRETWGLAIPEMFRSHPNLADSSLLSDSDRSFILGYISHLTVDEAFRDEVTVHVHGVENWQPIIRGLWSLADETQIGYHEIVKEIDRYSRQDTIGFIDCQVVGQFLSMARPWAIEDDPWKVEKVFLGFLSSQKSHDQDRLKLDRNRILANPFLEPDRRQRFVSRAVETGYRAVSKYLDGEFSGP